MSGDGGFGQMYRKLGYSPSAQVCESGFLELICGRIYADPERLPGLFFDGLPMGYDLDALAADKSLLDAAPTVFDPQKADNNFLLRLLPNLATMWKVSRNVRRMAAGALDRFEKDVLPPFLDYVERKRAMKLDELPDDELPAELADLKNTVMREFAPESLLPGFFGGSALARATAIMAGVLGETEAVQQANTLTKALDGDITVEQDDMLYKVAAGELELDAFIDKFGHRCIGEMELANPRWNEDDTALRNMIGQLKGAQTHNPHAMHEANAAERTAADADLPARLADSGGASLLEQIQRELGIARELLPCRETGKYYLMMGYELIRRVINEFGRRHGLGADVYFLKLDELERVAADPAQFHEVIQARRIRRESAKRLVMPDVVDSDELGRLGFLPDVDDEGAMKGASISSGIATGPARIVFDPSEASALGVGYILVCPSTDPGWTPLFINAAGLIVERGGVLSHGAIVARDFGIPAVVVPGITRRIEDGAILQVDGNSGTVVVVGGEQADASAGGKGDAR